MESKTAILYGEQTRLSLENMSFSGRMLSSYPEYVKALAQVKKSCAKANFKTDQLSQAKYEAISKACDEIVSGKYLEFFPVDVYHGGGNIAVNLNMNEVIFQLTENCCLVEEINFSQSTADTCHTALYLTLSRELARLLKGMDQLIDTLKLKVEEFAHLQTVARTCYQDGMVVSVHHLFSGLISALSIERKSLIRLKGQFALINLGFTVIGSGTGATDAYRSHILTCLEEVTTLRLQFVENPYAVAQYPLDVVNLSVHVRNIAALLAKFARDLRFLASGPECGISEVMLPHVQKGSSFFKEKNNPVVPEMVVNCYLLISGNDSVIRESLSLGETYLNLQEGMMGFLLLDSLSMLVNAIKRFEEKCLKDLKINRDRCKEFVHRIQKGGEK